MKTTDSRQLLTNNRHPRHGPKKRTLLEPQNNQKGTKGDEVQMQ